MFRRIISLAVVVILSVGLVEFAQSGVLDGKSVRAVWNFTTINQGKPVGDEIVPGDIVDDISGNGIGLEVASPQPIKVIPGVSGKALVFEPNMTTWLKETKSPSALHLTDSFTIAVWCRISGFNESNGNLISKNDWSENRHCFDFGITPARDSRMQLFGGGENLIQKDGSCGPVSEDSKHWQFLVITFDGNKSEMRGYKNGILVGEAVKTPFNAVNDYDVPVTVGCNLSYGKPAALFRGHISKITILGEVLSASEIKKIYEEEGKEFLKETDDWNKETERLMKQLQN